MAPTGDWQIADRATGSCSPRCSASAPKNAPPTSAPPRTGAGRAHAVRSCFCRSQAFAVAPLRKSEELRKTGPPVPRARRNARLREPPDAPDSPRRTATDGARHRWPLPPTVGYLPGARLRRARSRRPSGLSPTGRRHRLRLRARRLGTHRNITTRSVGSGRTCAIARLRLWDGELHRVTATADTAPAARTLELRIAERLRLSELHAWRYLRPTTPSTNSCECGSKTSRGSRR